MKSKRVGGTATVLLLGIALSGCVVFQGPVKVRQVGDKPRVEVKFKICNSDGEDSPEPRCPNLGNSNSDGDNTATNSGEEVLMGFRVPRGTELPERIRSTSFEGAGSFRPLPQYTDALNELAPTRDGYRWFGYSAPPYAKDGQGNDVVRFDAARFKVKMRVPDRIVGEKFKVRPVVGWYDDADTPDGLDCGPDPFVFYNDGQQTSTICIDSPTRQQTRKSIKVKIEPKG